jgi:hypothetical protein
VKATRRRPRGENYKEKATRRKLQRIPRGESYKEKTARRKLQGEGHE